MRHADVMGLLVGICALLGTGCGQNVQDCGMCGCGNRGTTETVRKPYTKCTSGLDAASDAASDAPSDADMEASTDASSDASSDADIADAETMCKASCWQACEQQGSPQKFLDTCSDELDDIGQTIAVCVYGPPPCGRRPPGLSAAHRDGNGLGDFLARAAHLEAASIHAFRTLARELDEHGAPAHLRRSALQAASDERRHARVMSRLARRHGAQVARVKVARTRRRPLRDIARENAVEGCVREAYGALVAVWQSRHANDPDVRDAMQRISHDEARHAALAWQVDAWASEKLGATFAQDRAQAWRDLEQEIAATPPTEMVNAFGVPNRAIALELVRALRRALETTINPAG